MSNEAQQLTEWLQSPAAYQPPPQRVERIDTHISSVFLADDLVYKLKKRVKYDFLDFSTLAAREQACREEVRLNSRLAPDIYVGVEPITREAGGSFAISGKGEVVDWLVKMRRLPLDQTMLALHERGRLTDEHVERLAKVLVRFYKDLHPLAVAPEEYRAAYLHHVQYNGRELLAAEHHLPKAMVRRAQAFQLQLLQLRPALFDERVKAGRIFDGHGDLRPEHICFSEPLAIFDCLEFNAELRRIDAADELAFLAAECDFIDAEWVGPQLVREYLTQSGDSLPAILFDFYKCYRACVRAKVAALRADQLRDEAAAQAAAEAKRHLELADRYAAPYARPLLIVIGGLSGSGKSTLAAALAEALGAQWLRTDVLRRELNTTGYDPKQRIRVYQEMASRGEALWSAGVSVVLDGTFSTAAGLQAIRDLTSNRAALYIECRCRPEVARERIEKRLAKGADPSQATLQVFEQQLQQWKAWPAELHSLTIDTEQPLAAQLELVRAQLAAR
jgi:aminoglycoside phosphotransferase family enzyme/predicted kinase